MLFREKYNIRLNSWVPFILPFSNECLFRTSHHHHSSSFMLTWKYKQNNKASLSFLKYLHYLTLLNAKVSSLRTVGSPLPQGHPIQLIINSKQNPICNMLYVIIFEKRRRRIDKELLHLYYIMFILVIKGIFFSFKEIIIFLPVKKGFFKNFFAFSFNLSFNLDAIILKLKN